MTADEIAEEIERMWVLFPAGDNRRARIRELAAGVRALETQPTPEPAPVDVSCPVCGVPSGNPCVKGPGNKWWAGLGSHRARVLAASRRPSPGDAPAGGKGGE